MRKEIRIFLISLIAVLLLILFPSKTQASTPFDSVVFDGEFYLSNNADLRAAFGNDYQSAYNHFMSYGIREGRQASLSFDVKYYLAYYSDLSNAFHGNYAEALNHFMIFGIKEGRKSSPYFDVKYYLSNNSDLQRAFKNDYEAAGNHFLIFGLREGRRGSKYFDVKYYLNSNPDLKNAFKTDYMRAYDHYRIFGIKEGRNPSEDVNIKCYLNSYVDLQREFKGNYEKAAEHYYIFGEREGRKATHTIVEMKAVSATCEKTGLTKGKKCETCGEIMEKQNEVPKTKHTVGEVVYVWNETTSAKAIFNCEVCKKDIEADVKITNEVTKEPSCYEKGVKTYTATASYDGKVIGTNQKTEEIAATGQHSFGDWKLGEDGKLERQCKTTGCTQKETKEVEETKVKIEKPVSTPDLDDWGYDHNHVEGKGYELTNEDSKNGKLSGIIAEQTINENVYGEDKATGYYFAITVDLENAKVDHLSSDVKFVPTVRMVNGTVDKVVTLENEDDTLTILVKIDDDKTKNDDCSNECACKGEGKVADCKCDKKVVLTIDLDGEKGAYSETTYTIDYCNVTFEKDSKFEIKKELPESAKEAIKGQFNTWGFNPESVKDFEKYSTGLKIESVENDPHTVKVNGLLPLMKLTADGAFGKEATEKEGYYFVYVIKTEKSVGKNSPSTGEVYQSVEVKVPENGELEPTKVLNKDSFDTDNELAILMKVDPNNENKKFKVIVDMDGSGKSCAPYEITVDYSELEFQQKTTAEINVKGDGSDVPQSDKELLTEWGYQFPDNIELSKENSEHEDQELSYDSETGLLSGTIKEQKLKDGFSAKDLDSYFYTFTIKPNKVTDNIKVTITDISGTETYNKDNFADGVLTILEHIPTTFAKCEGEECCDAESGKCTDATKCSKAVTIKIDADGTDDNHYTESTVYYIDFCNVDFVNLHTVSFDDNNNKVTKTETVYDGEKLNKPENPVKEKHEVDVNQYNTFAHWNKNNDDQEFKFGEDGKSVEPISEDLTLYPIWEIDVDQYISDAITKINEKEGTKDKFEIEKDENEENVLTVEIKDRDAKIDEISDTAIASTIKHALESGEIDSINLELEKVSEEFKVSDKDNVSQKLKDFFGTKLLTEENKTLNDLCTKCNEKELELAIFPNTKVAKIKDKTEQAGTTYTIKFEKEVQVTFDAGALKNPETEYIKPDELGKKDDDLPIPTISTDEQKYRTFDGWFDSESKQVTKFNEITEDTDLTAHYTLNVDEFVNEVISDLNSTDTTYSDNFTDKINLAQDTTNNTITINVVNPNLPVSTLADTSIPGTIAYVLEREEIKDITLSLDGEEQQFTKDKDDLTELKNDVITEAKALFNSKLNQKEADATLDQLEYTDKSFTIKIGEVADTVKLVDSNGEKVEQDNEKTYTFKFNSSEGENSHFAVVNASPKSELGAKTIDEVLNKNEYDTIYVDSDLSITEPITVSKDVTIKSLENTSSGIALASENVHTVTVNSEKDYVIDVQSGTVTISDLKLTGGKKAELKVEEGANVTVNNVDVSGEITAPTKSQESDQMNAAILVKGNLTVNSVKNDKESYKVPTIAVVTSWEYPKEQVVEDKEKEGDLGPNGKVTVSGMKMTKNGSYNIIKKDAKENIDSIEETYYGSFYYINENNSQIYFVGIMDANKKAGRPYDYIKIYYYDEKLDFESLGYKVGETPNDIDDDKKDSVVFKNFTLASSGKEIKGDEKAQEVFKPHDTNMVNVNYVPKPSAVVNMQEGNGLSLSGNAIGNTLSGTLESQDEDSGKYYIPLTLTSDKYENGKTTVKVTDPNNVTTSYKYNGTETLEKEENQMSTMSVANLESKTVKLNLEAIKSSNITTENGKVYKIAIDIDGAEGSDYQEEVYTIDYNNVETLEEIINQAATDTQNANNLKYTKKNNVKGRKEDFTLEYDKELGRENYKDEENKEFYAFLKKDFTGVDSKYSVVAQKEQKSDDGRIYLNDWVYSSSLIIKYGVNELNLLQDLIKDDSVVVESIDKVVKKEDQDNTYEITINEERLKDWLNALYLDVENKEGIQGDVNGDKVEVKLIVTLTEGKDGKKYVGSIKTSANFSITDNNNVTTTDNSIDVTISGVGETTLKEPKEMLKAQDGQEVTKEEIIDFITKGEEWWKSHINNG